MTSDSFDPELEELNFGWTLQGCLFSLFSCCFLLKWWLLFSSSSLRLSVNNFLPLVFIPVLKLRKKNHVYNIFQNYLCAVWRKDLHPEFHKILWRAFWVCNCDFSVFLELVSKELNHFGVIADLFRQIGGHSSRFVLFCYFWRLFTIKMIKSVKVFSFSFWKIITKKFFFYFIKFKPPA